MRASTAMGIGLCLVLPLQESLAVTNFLYGGIYSEWPAEWIPILSLNDPDDGKTECYDFVGDDTDPAAYWNANTDYFYFRMRVDDGTPGSNLWGGTLWVLVDQMDNGTGTPDYAFAWDYKSNQQDWHGLEYQGPNTVGEWWGETKMEDLDGESNWKVSPPDFPLSGSAFLRTIEEVTTASFGTTTLIDMALPWSTIDGTNSTLAYGQAWALQIGSTANANDQNFIDTDVGAFHNPTNMGFSWSDTVVVPEPATVNLMLAGLVALGCALFALKR